MPPFALAQGSDPCLVRATAHAALGAVLSLSFATLAVAAKNVAG